MRLLCTALLLGFSCLSSPAFGADPFPSQYPHIVGSDVAPSELFPGINFEASADPKPETVPMTKGSSRQEVRMEHYNDWVASLGKANQSRTFTLMLFCREVAEDERQYVARLYSSFLSFSHYIGSTNTAVWIGPRRPPSFDLKLGKDLCDQFHLDYNAGPYVLYYRIKDASSSSSWTGADLPDIHLKTEYVVMNLHRLTAERIPHLLNRLETYIRNNVNMSLIAVPLQFEQMSQYLFSFGDYYKEILLGAILKGKAEFILKWPLNS